jgi:hypothetical protein
MRKIFRGGMSSTGMRGFEFDDAPVRHGPPARPEVTGYSRVKARPAVPAPTPAPAKPVKATKRKADR